MNTQADLVSAASTVLTNSGLAGQVATTDTTAVLTLTATEVGPSGPEQVVLTITIGAMDGSGVVSAAATLQQSATLLWEAAGNACTLAGANAAAYGIVTWWNSP